MTAASPATIAVRGSSTAEVPPELARVRVSVEARSSDRGRALHDLTQRIGEVRAALEGYADGVESVDAGPVWVRPQVKEGRPRERITGYLAGAALTATVVDFAVLGDLLLRLADRDMVALEGPFWGLRPDSPSHRRVRIRAVEDARQRAEEYAEAAGVRLTGLVQIADTGLSGERAAPLAARAAALGRSVADELSFDVQPVPQAVYADVEVRFTCSQPEFG